MRLNTADKKGVVDTYNYRILGPGRAEFAGMCEANFQFLLNCRIKMLFSTHLSINFGIHWQICSEKDSSAHNENWQEQIFPEKMGVYKSCRHDTAFEKLSD